MHKLLRESARLGLLAATLLHASCGDVAAAHPIDDALARAETWSPGQVEDARGAPEEKIDIYVPRFGRKRPLIAVVALNAGTELADYATPYGVLSHADVADVVAISTAPGIVTARPLKLALDQTTAQFSALHPDGADYVIVPFVQGERDPTLLGFITEQAGKGATIVSICNGGLIVAQTGLMDGHRATAHWGSESRRAADFPAVRWQKNTRFVADGKIVSSAGISAAIPISMALVEAIAGRPHAEAVARELGVANWSSRHDSDAFALRPGESPPNMGAPPPAATVGLPVRDGIDEIALALTADAYQFSRQVSVFAVADGLAPITAQRGLRVVPERTPDQVDRVLPAIEAGAGVRALDGALHAIETSYGKAAACFAARSMEHPSFASCR